MKYRPLPQLYMNVALTFGIYELFWLSWTRQELIDRTSVRIARVRWIVLIRILNFVSYIVFIIAVLMLSSVGSKSALSTDCYRRYMFSTASPDIKQAIQTQGSDFEYTDECKRQKAAEDANQARTSHAFEIMGISFAVMIATTLLFYRWLRDYATAVRVVTGGTTSQTVAMYMLGLAPPGVGIIAMQSVFNGLSDQQPLQPVQAFVNQALPEEHPFAKKVLVVIAAALGLFVAATVAIIAASLS